MVMRCITILLPEHKKAIKLVKLVVEMWTP